MSWELFNEVIWTDDFDNHKEKVADWHLEMAHFLKNNDPNGHLVTTSYGSDLTDENVWSHPDIDFTQNHFYINTPHLERVLADANYRFLEAFEKPSLSGEFGLGTSADLANADPDGIHLHNAIWGSLFSGALGTAMTWWWDSYVHPQDLYHHFGPLASFAHGLPFLEKNLRPATASIAGLPGDLVLTPTLGWAGIGEASVAIDEAGSLSPQGAALGQFLYGSLWNTQFRSPPTFSVFCPSDVEFRVKTGSETGLGPVIAIYLDGNLLVEENALPNAQYSINVPAGFHEIKVDNLGTDWISIAAYTFTGLGSLLDHFILQAEDSTLAAGWILNKAYNHEYLAANGEPATAVGGTLRLPDMPIGHYTVKWFDCLTGALVAEDSIGPGNDEVSFGLPAILWDLAFVVEGTTGTVATEERRANLPFSLSPNPARPGSTIQLHTGEAVGSEAQIAILDSSGKILQRFHYAGEWPWPEGLGTGLFWIKIESGQKVGARPIVVMGN
jgi:hypothetical protein